MEEDDDDDPSFDPSNPATKAIKPVTGGRGRKSTRYSESRSTRSKEPKAKAPPKETGRKNKRKSQPKKVSKWVESSKPSKNIEIFGKERSKRKGKRIRKENNKSTLVLESKKKEKGVKNGRLGDLKQGADQCFAV
jgi:hypothetical protein